MNDELGCFVCFASVVFGGGLVLLVIAWNDARAKLAAMQQYLQGEAAEASALRRSVADLERRLRALESSGVRPLAPDVAPSTYAREAPRAVEVEAQTAQVGQARPFERSLPPAPEPIAPEPTAIEPTDAQERSTFARPASAEPPSGDVPPTDVAPVAASEPTADVAPPSVDMQPTVVASPAAAAVPPPPASPPPARPVVTPRPDAPNLEQWLGVRGAAAAGSIVLAIAGVYFFRFSLEHGLISETTRVIIGLLVGMGCVLVSEFRLRHTHRILSQFLAGAGFAVLYLSVWAAVALYHLIPSAAATVAMIAITTSSCALAYVRHAAPTAALGLIGGFATPIDRPREHR